MPTVHDNKDRQRYELLQDGHLAIAAYERDGDTIIFTHTVVPDALRGMGVGSTLVKAALEDARSRGLKVVPQCPFVAAYIAKHPEWRDLVAE